MRLTTKFLILAALICIHQTSFGQEEPTKPAQNGDNKILLNFRGANLDAVLDYLSEIAGFVIVKQTDVSGQIDVWSRQPLSRDEAINLLNTVLHEKGYAAIRNERILTIVNRDDAIRKDIPVKTGNNPEQVPKTDEMITQIIPVRYTDAMALIDNLEPLLAEYATMTANESSNAVVITDTQANIHRMMSIIRALDTSISSISAINVYQLKYTDATELADIVNELFEIEDSNNNSRGGRGGGPGGFFGRGGPPGGGEENTDSEARKAASRVVAVADENTNALIVSAPEEYMPAITELVSQVDLAVSDLTEIQVFRLEYADAYEMADQIEELFPDDSTQTETNFPRFGPPGMFGRGGGQQQNNNESDRQLQQTTVRSVADPRTNSVVVFAAHDTMLQIEQMIKRLDSDTAKKQKVFVYRLEYADVDNLAEILRNIFESQNTNINRTTNTNQNTLSNRSVNIDSNDTQPFN